MIQRFAFSLVIFLVSLPTYSTALKGVVIDQDTREPLPCRMYIQDEQGNWFFPRSASSEGSAVYYKKQHGDKPGSHEMHTTLSAHPFVADLKPGTYTLTVERGKEYFPVTQQVQVGNQPIKKTFSLQRWIDLAKLGWYSGDTHVHRTVEDLPNVMLAEDVNVTFPLLDWVREAFVSPAKSSNSSTQNYSSLIQVDSNHVICTRNTEYEIFSVNGKSHTLGAFFVLNHRSSFDKGVPPVVPVAQQAHAEGGLIELDKHAWPWSMALVPIMDVDLYELSNNHVWRTEFGFPSFGEAAADYMHIERTEKGWTEQGWIDYGFQNYYALLNCGYHLRPTAGTASGVHPVPLGFSRVYVYVGKEFKFNAWMQGLNAGRSFVTSGPMLFAEIDQEKPGTHWQKEGIYQVRGSVVSEQPLDTIDIIMNGEVHTSLHPHNRSNDAQAYETHFSVAITIKQSSWLAVRCFERRPGRRIRFAHTAPFYFDIKDKPLTPKKEEVNFLIQRVQKQILRSKNILPLSAIREYEQALRSFQDKL